MDNPTPQLNNPIPNPNLKDLLALLKKDIFLSLSCCHIGTIQKISTTTQRVDVSINYTKTVSKLDKVKGKYIPVQESYGLLLDLPVFIIGGADACLTMPIAVGDTCAVLFNDRAMDNWYQSGQVGQSPPSTRLHSFADGIALVGVRSANKAIANYDATRAVLRNGNAQVAVGTSLIKIANDTYDLKALLQELITDLKTLITQTAAITVIGVTSGGGTSGLPANAAAITAISAQLDTVSTKIAGLLE